MHLYIYLHLLHIFDNKLVVIKIDLQLINF